MPDFLGHLSDASRSPLAFVAYALVLAAWILNTWLTGNPQRQAQKILTDFKDDQRRLDALVEVFHEQPPHELSGNEAILSWVEGKSRDRTRLLLLIAWIATVVAVLLFLVAIRNQAAAATGHDVTINFHRPGTTGDCPSLALTAQLTVSSGGKRLATVGVTDGCKARLSSSATGSATLSLNNAGDYRLSNSQEEYQLGSTVWDVNVANVVVNQGQTQTSRLRLTVFQYSSIGCPDSGGAFDTFQQILGAKARSLRGMFNGTDHRYDYLSNLSVVSAGQPLQMNNQEIQNYWAQTASLQILSGLCVRQNNTDFMRSQIFSGTLGGNLAEPLVADLPLSADELGAARDMHTASILYTLARDSREMKADPDVTLSYLDLAQQLATGIHSDGATKLLAAIQTTLTEVGPPGQLHL